MRVIWSNLNERFFVYNTRDGTPSIIADVPDHWNISYDGKKGFTWTPIELSSRTMLSPTVQVLKLHFERCNLFRLQNYEFIGKKTIPSIMRTFVKQI